MKLRHLARLAARRRGAAARAVRARRFAQTGTDPVHRRHSRRAAPIDPYARIIADHDGEDARPDHHRREQARRQRQHLGAVHRRAAGRRPADLGRHPGLHRDQSRARSTTSAGRSTISCRSSAASRRRWCSSAHPSVPANTFAEFLTWAKANKRQAQLFVLQPGTPSHFLGYPAQREVRPRSHPRALSRLRACRPTALIGGHSLFGFAQVNSTVPQYAGRQAQGARHHQRRALTARCRTCRPSPSLAIRNSPPRSGSACW